MLTAQELQTKRQEHQMTQAQLAQVTGVEASLIARYEQGEVPIPAEMEEKFQAAWQRPTGVPKASKPHPAAPPARKPTRTRAPSVSQWLQSVAHDDPERRAAPAATPDATGTTAPNQIVQAAAQITNDKQRRLAVHNLLTAALDQLDKLFADDRQLRVLAEAVDQLAPAYREIVLGLIDQFEQLDPAAPTRTRSGPDQIVQSLKDPSAYVTALNYLEAAIQLLRQADLADRPALMTRLQNLSEYDLNTVQMISKRYQAPSKGQAGEHPPSEGDAHGKAD